MAKRKPKQVYGTVTGEPGDQLFHGAETGVFKPRENRVISGGTWGAVQVDSPLNWLNKELGQASRDAEEILRGYLGDEWQSECKKLNNLFLTTGIVQEYLGGGVRVPSGGTLIKVANQIVIQVPIDPLNYKLRETLLQQQIEQLLDATELLFKISWLRLNPLGDETIEMKVLQGIKIGQLWQQMKLRAIEADAVRGKVTVQAAGAGGKAVAKLTDEQKRVVRNAAEEAKLHGKKLTAIDARFAKEFNVSTKTIERVRNEKPSDNPANV